MIDHDSLPVRAAGLRAGSSAPPSRSASRSLSGTVWGSSPKSTAFLSPTWCAAPLTDCFAAIPPLIPRGRCKARRRSRHRSGAESRDFAGPNRRGNGQFFVVGYGIDTVSYALRGLTDCEATTAFIGQREDPFVAGGVVNPLDAGRGRTMSTLLTLVADGRFSRAQPRRRNSASRSASVTCFSTQKALSPTCWREPAGSSRWNAWAKARRLLGPWRMPSV